MSCSRHECPLHVRSSNASRSPRLSSRQQHNNKPRLLSLCIKVCFLTIYFHIDHIAAYLFHVSYNDKAMPGTFCRYGHLPEFVQKGSDSRASARFGRRNAVRTWPTKWVLGLIFCLTQEKEVPTTSSVWSLSFDAILELSLLFSPGRLQSKTWKNCTALFRIQSIQVQMESTQVQV